MLQPNKVEKEYQNLLKTNKKSIKENSIVQSHIKWQKAINDLSLAEGLLKISNSKKIKDVLNFSKSISFFDWVIVCSYYSIFHATQALLGIKKIKITNRIHHATIISFAKHYIINGELADEFFFIYEDAENKAKSLLEIFEKEKTKRGLFQYHRLSKNNFEPANESVNNAKTFLRAVNEVLVKNNIV